MPRISPIYPHTGPDEIDIRNAQGLVKEYDIKYPGQQILASDIRLTISFSSEQYKPSQRTVSPLSGSELCTWVNSLKRRCAGCGEPDPTALVFHHLDRSEKSMTVSTMVGRRFTKTEILDEIGSGRGALIASTGIVKGYL